MNVGTTFMAEMTWTEVAELVTAELHVVILPLGSCEAHGPHAPIGTDTIISDAIIAEAVRKVEDRGITCVVLPAIDYGVTDYASGFSGTISISRELLESLIVEIGSSLRVSGFKKIWLVNNHLEPEHIKAIYNAMSKLNAIGMEGGYLDITRKKRATRLTQEFKSGDCHAGRYETSIVLAARPELVKEAVMESLAPTRVQLVQKMSAGLKDFREFGMSQAYCGSPAEATAAEGLETLGVLSDMQAEAIYAFVVLGETDSPGAYQAF